MKKALYGALALSAALALPATQAQGGNDATKFRRTIYAPAGEMILALEAPLGMCFLDPSYYLEYMLYRNVQDVTYDLDAGQLLGLFAPCDSAAGFSHGASRNMPVVGIVTWLNPQVGDTTGMSLPEYLDMQEESYAGVLSTTIGGAPDPASEHAEVEKKMPTMKDVVREKTPGATARGGDDGELPDLNAVIKEADRLMDEAGGVRGGSAGGYAGDGMATGFMLPKPPAEDIPGTEKFLDMTPLTAGLQKVTTLPKPPTEDDPRTFKDYDHSGLRDGLMKTVRLPKPPSEDDPALAKDFDSSGLHDGLMKKVPRPDGDAPVAADEDDLSAAIASVDANAAALPLLPGYTALMLPAPGEYSFEDRTRRTDAGVTVGFEAAVRRDTGAQRSRGIVGTTSLKQAPIQVMMSWTGKDTLPSVSKMRDTMDVFLAQQVALNNK